MCVCVCVCMLACMHACVCSCVHAFHACLSCMRACMRACMRMYVCMYICMYVCMYIIIATPIMVVVCLKGFSDTLQQQPQAIQATLVLFLQQQPQAIQETLVLFPTTTIPSYTSYTCPFSYNNKPKLYILHLAFFSTIATPKLNNASVVHGRRHSMLCYVSLFNKYLFILLIFNSFNLSLRCRLTGYQFHHGLESSKPAFPTNLVEDSNDTYM